MMGQTFRQMGWEDREVKVKRDALLDVLRKNRAKHIEDYKEACDGYRDQALKRIDEIFTEARGTISRLKEGQTVAFMGFQFGLPVPESHEKSYDQIIRMMEMSVDQEITLTCSQFGCFVMDDWDWKQSWANSNSTYMKKA